MDALALLLALTLVFNTQVPRRTRLLTFLFAGTALLSLQWAPTNLAWNAFATPNGSPYRQAFVVCGLLVIAGWTSYAHGAPKPRHILAALSSDVTEYYTWPIAVLGTAVAAGALLGLTYPAARDPAPSGPGTGLRPFRLMLTADAYATWIVGVALVRGVDTPGYATLLTIVTALAGADMIMVGVIGEYVGRIYYEVKRRPHYLVKETTTTVREEPWLTGSRTETRAVPGPGVTESSWVTNGRPTARPGTPRRPTAG